ncbi:MAG: thiamine pyrophosphate-binding protein, partial [Boseongicola sp. SB0673_bin_14]|nr:thiamine pyrophosphate-binding protein [Boseongicola sp. SB0673_bin_14]
ANRALYEADLVLFVGSHTGSQVTTEWTIPAKGMRIIQIDIDPIEIGRSYPVEVGLQGDAKATLRRLIDASEAGNGRAEWVARAQRLVQEWRDQIEPRLTSDAVPIIPDRLCAELTAVLDEESILVVDTGHAGIWTAGMIDFNNPGQMILRCAGSLGWGLPASIGAQLARPDKKVVCFTGDGGIWYHIGEIETAVRCGAPVTIVVNNNSGYIQDKGGDDISYAKVPGTDSADLWQFNDTNFAKLAENMGALGIRVEQPGDIRIAIEEAMASGRTALVDVATDPADGNPPERWNPPG